MMPFEELRIRDVVIRPAHILAPMAGITDTVFRRFIKRLGGCGLIMTEFVSSEGMLRQNLKSKRFLYYTEEERPITAQIFGSEPARLAELRARYVAWERSIPAIPGDAAVNIAGMQVSRHDKGGAALVALVLAAATLRRRTP